MTLRDNAYADEQFHLAVEFFALQYARRLDRLYCAYGAPQALFPFLKADGYEAGDALVHNQEPFGVWWIPSARIRYETPAHMFQRRLADFIAVEAWGRPTQNRLHALLARLTLENL